MKSIFEEMGGIYRQEGDYLLPNLSLPTTVEEYQIGKYGRMRMRYLKKHRPIRIEYGDILKKKKCRRVINFDECFTTEVGGNVGDISPTSICGQYLTQNPNIDMQKLIRDSNLVPLQRKSKYNQLTCYQPGSIVPCGDDLLMAFAPLDENGRGGFHSRKEYLECLSKLWEEIDKYFEPRDVCIPLLGAGRTHFESSSGASYSSQELLDIIINSYKLSSCKIKSPYKLRIVVKKNVGISLDKISN